MEEAVLTNHIVLDTIPLDTVPPLIIMKKQFIADTN